MQEHTPQLALFTSALHDPTQEIPYGYCQCGCGQLTGICNEARPDRGLVKGAPYRFVKGHGGRRPILERFWEKVDKRSPDECWLWTGGLVSGYGSFKADKERVKAHRFSYELHYGPIFDGLLVCHRCDVPKCVNPNHLFLGTYADNMDDMVAKDRHKSPRGLERYHRKLSEETILEIRKLRAQGRTIKDVAAELGISADQAWYATQDGAWKHVISPP